MAVLMAAILATVCPETMSSTFAPKKTILLIEDNVDDERITLRALQRVNLMNEVVVACSGPEACDFIVHNSTPPDLIILDLHLTGMSGYEVLSRIRNAPSYELVPVVVYSASEDASEVAKCYAMGANSFVLKPTDFAEYEEAVLQLAMYWLLLNRVAYSKVLV